MSLKTFVWYISLKGAENYLRKTLLGPNTNLSLKEYMKQLSLSTSLLSVERACSLRQAAKLIHVIGDADAGSLSVQTLSGIAPEQSLRCCLP